MGHADLSGKLNLCSLVGAQGNKLAAFDHLNQMVTTSAWRRRRATMRHHGIRFIVAYLFAGNENIRAQVAAFCSLLNGLAAEAGGAVLFIGYPNKAGQEFSGSTAWENQVRSRLFLGRLADRKADRAEDGGDAEIADPNARVLTRGKANYARNGETISFRWWRWAFVLDDELAP